jgi:hypothetical protein
MTETRMNMAAVTEEQIERAQTKAALRAYAEASKGERCPICNGIEGCDHTVRERLLADLATPQDSAAHDWFQFNGMKCCRVCGNVWNATSDTRACKGPVKVSTREQESAALREGLMKALARFDRNAPDLQAMIQLIDYLREALSPEGTL